jgi:TPR repeat protein
MPLLPFRHRGGFKPALTTYLQAGDFMTRATVLMAMCVSAAAASAQTSAELCARTAKDGNIQMCQAAVAANPRDLASRKHLAYAYLALNNDINCFRTHDEIVRLAPDDPDSHYLFAVALMTFGRFQDAVEPARIALRLNPNDLPTVQIAALVFEATRHEDEAFAAFRRGAALGDPLLMFDTAMAYAQGRGTPRDDAASFAWLTRAAEGGHVTAMVMLSEIYRDGRAGVTPDAGRAAHWAARAKAEGAAD